MTDTVEMQIYHSVILLINFFKDEHGRALVCKNFGVVSIFFKMNGVENKFLRKFLGRDP